MSEKLTYKQRQAKAKRIKYWFQKNVNVGLVPHVLDTEDQLREMFREWKEAQGRPVIPDEDLKTVEQQDTSIDEFYKVKAEWKKDIDKEWLRKVNLDREADEGGTYSERSERLRWGESPLIFGIISPKTHTFLMKSDTDKYITRKHESKKKKKSGWNF